MRFDPPGLAFSTMVAIAPLLTAVLAPAPLPAQEPTAELTGCYDITVGDWYVLEYGRWGSEAAFPHERSDSLDFELPSRIEFGGPYGRHDPKHPRVQVIMPESALPSIHAIAFAELVTTRYTWCSAPVTRGWRSA